jgi:exodeoxyribonuclease V alpha subunit
LPIGADAAQGDEPPAFVFLEHDHPRQVLDATVHWCRQQIPQRYGLDPIAGIQVLTPMHKGMLGTLNLNTVLQRALNPDAAGIAVDGYHFKLGDKVIHLVNNYPKEVFNGDIGVIHGIDATVKTILVDYDGRQVGYGAGELHELAAAYAITVHKSQGSEYPAVVVPLVTQHYVMLQRNVLYTALTRARQLAVLIGSRKALEICVRRDQPGRRLTRLSERLREGALD